NDEGSKNIYRLILSNDQLETTCCAHCGLLRHRQLKQDISHAICQDFLLGTTISASSSYYVMDTTLSISCCQPQVLTFQHRSNAEKFVKGFGGDVYEFTEAMEIVYQSMQGSSTCCSKEG